MKLLTLLILVLPLFVAAQTKNSVKGKKPSSSTLDVDKLYQKYKDYDTVTIHSSDGDIKAIVSIEYNDAGKPYAVILYGWTVFGNVDGLIRELGRSKTASGYVFNGVTTVHYEGETVTADLYEKKTQYAKYGYVHWDDRWVFNEKGERTLRQPAQGFFYFEVGDVLRRNTGKQERFSF